MTASLFHIETTGSSRVSAVRLAQKFSSILLIACLSVAAGCAARRPVGVNYIVPVQAAKKIELVDCDRSSPPHCKHERVTYAKGAEQIAVNP
jgi:hypothetical protein